MHTGRRRRTGALRQKKVILSTIFWDENYAKKLLIGQKKFFSVKNQNKFSFQSTNTKNIVPKGHEQVLGTAIN